MPNGVNGDRAGTMAAPLNPQLGAIQVTGTALLYRVPLPASPLAKTGNPSLDASHGLTADERGSQRLPGAPSRSGPSTSPRPY